MDWLILILGVPAILIPLVLLFGFADRDVVDQYLCRCRRMVRDQ
jgi:hypothetical protein